MKCGPTEQQELTAIGKNSNFSHAATCSENKREIEGERKTAVG